MECSQLSRRATLGRLTAAALALGSPVLVRAQGAFPQRPVQLVVPFGPGGVADLTARAVAQAMAASLGQPFVVENKPGAHSVVASTAVAGATPDGHTLLLMSNGHAVAAALSRKLPYDARRDFAPVCLLARFDLALFCSASARFKSLADVLAEARARPGRLTIGTIAQGSTQHLAAELLRHSAGLDVTLVPYKASPAVLTALRGGEIDLAIEILGPWLPQVQGGQLRALAVSGTQRHAELPDVPTLAQAGGPGLKGYDVASWNALAAPARTPPEVLARLNRAANDALRQGAVQAQFKALGVQVQGGSAEQLAALLDADTRRWTEVVRRARIEPE